MKVYDRTENGTTVQVSVREGLGEINTAMMGGRKSVRTMSQINRTDFAIEYRDGRNVRLVQVDAPDPATDDTGGADWSVSASTNLAHRFTTETHRARCNRSIRANDHTRDHNEYRNRNFFAESGVWRICTRCDSKP